MRKRLKFSTVIGGLVFLLYSMALTAGQISITSSGLLNNTGDTVQVMLRASGFTSASGDSISAFDVNFLFDPTVLAFTGFTFLDGASGQNQLDFPEIGAFPFLGDVQNLGTGILDAFAVSGNTPSSLDANQLGAFDLVTVHFQALRVAPTAVALDLSDPNLLFADSASSTLAVTYGRTTATFDAQAVPEPATAWMVIVAVISAIGLRGRRKRSLAR